MRKQKIRGEVVAVNEAYKELIADEDEATVYYLTNLAVHNMGADDIHIVVNDGDEILVKANEVMTCGEIKVYSLKIVESGSEIRYMGIQN